MSPSSNRARALSLQAVALAVATALSVPAYAQSEERNDELADVFVTAKRVIDSGASALGTRSLRDTPFSVYAISSEDIEKHQAASLATVFAKDASVAREGGTDYNMYAQRISVRGLSLDWVNSVRVNGLPLTYYGSTLPLEAVEEVHLLKGASGFLYGVGAPGGIVNYLTKRPTNAPVLNASVGFRSDQLFSQHIDVGGRVGDAGFGYRVNLVREQGETYAGSDVNRRAATGNFELPLGENVKWVTDVLYQRTDISRPEPLFVVDTAVYRDANLPGVIDSTRTLGSDQAYSNTEFLSGTTGVEWQIAAGWDLNVNYGKTYTDYRFPYETLRLQDAGGTYVNRLADYYDVFDYDFARALLQGRFDTGSLSHHITAGVSWQDLIIEYGTTNYTPRDQPGGNLFDYAPEVWTGVANSRIDGIKGSQYQEKSAYVSDTIGFTDQLSLLAGLRFTKYLQQSFNVFTGQRTSRYAKDAATPSLALIYKPRQSITGYLSFVQSLQQGPIAGTTYANAGELLDPIESDQIELGVKIEESGWALSAAVFRLSKGATYVSTTNTLVQGGEQLYDGIELGGRVRVGRSWTVGSSVVLLDATYTEGVNDWLRDRRLPGSSRFSGAFDVTYDVLSVAGLSVHADVKYLSEKVVSHIQAGDLSVSVPGFAVINFGGNWQTKLGGRDVSFNAEVRNVLDRRYWEGASNAFSAGAPRTLAFNARVNF